MVFYSSRNCLDHIVHFMHETMKTETKVDIADYLELYEFKKAYDEGRKVLVTSRREDRMFWIPIEEMNEEMHAFVRKYENASENWESEEEVRSYIERLERELNERKSIYNPREVHIKALEEKVRDGMDQISSLKSKVEFLIIALISTVIASLISILW